MAEIKSDVKGSVKSSFALEGNFFSLSEFTNQGSINAWMDDFKSNSRGHGSDSYSLELAKNPYAFNGGRATVPEVPMISPGTVYMIPRFGGQGYSSVTPAYGRTRFDNLSYSNTPSGYNNSRSYGCRNCLN